MDVRGKSACPKTSHDHMRKCLNSWDWASWEEGAQKHMVLGSALASIKLLLSPGAMLEPWSLFTEGVAHLFLTLICPDDVIPYSIPVARVR